MLISYNWLKDYIELSESPQEIAEILTLLGLEVENIEKYESVKGKLEGIVVGEVLKKEKHPNADKLSICQVNVGAETLQIICGAPNVQEGQKVPVALVGTTIFPGNNEKNAFKLKKAKIRGVTSYGMICSEYELGLGEDQSGILVLNTDAKPGTPLNQIYKIYEDTIFEIGLTPNRTDAMSHLGVARDLSAKLKRPLKLPNLDSINPEGYYENPVTIEVPSDDCPYYAGVVIKNLPPNIKSPNIIKNRLNAVGQKDINLYVDLTNYVMLSIGQPMHAFDLDKIKGNKIIVKNATQKQTVETLDKKQREIFPGDLLICDIERPLVFAGIIGTRTAEVDENTTNIFLESAYFNPTRIRKTRKRLNVQTESAFRFERGTDPNNVPNGLKLYLYLLQQIVPNIKYSKFNEVKKSEFPRKKIMFSFQKANKIAGTTLNKNEVIETLRFLDFEILQQDKETLNISIPTYRTDVTRFVDVMEEILRVIGYNEIPEKDFIQITTKQFSPYDELYNIKNKLTHRLVGKGWQQVLNNSLIDSEFATEDTIYIANPLGKAHSILRPTLIYGGIQNLKDAFNRGLSAWKIYEIGKIYYKNNNAYNETLKIAFWCASKKIQHWQKTGEIYDFWTIKEIIYFLLQQANICDPQEKVITEHPYLAYGLQINDNIIIGQIKPSITKKFDVDFPIFYGEMNLQQYLEQLLHTRKNTIFKEMPKYPGTTKDISMIIPSNVSYTNIIETIIKSQVKDIEKVSLFDVYKINDNERSYAIRIFFRNPSRTLTSDEVNKRLNKIIEFIEKHLPVKVRKQ